MEVGKEDAVPKRTPADLYYRRKKWAPHLQHATALSDVLLAPSTPTPTSASAGAGVSAAGSGTTESLLLQSGNVATGRPAVEPITPVRQSVVDAPMSAALPNSTSSMALQRLHPTQLPAAADHSTTTPPGSPLLPTPVPRRNSVRLSVTAQSLQVIADKLAQAPPPEPVGGIPASRRSQSVISPLQRKSTVNRHTHNVSQWARRNSGLAFGANPNAEAKPKTLKERLRNCTFRVILTTLNIVLLFLAILVITLYTVQRGVA